MNRHGIYISRPLDGLVFIAERSRKATIDSYGWGPMPLMMRPTGGHSPG
jgi:hypothetical protein